MKIFKKEEEILEAYKDGSKKYNYICIICNDNTITPFSHLLNKHGMQYIKVTHPEMAKLFITLKK